MAEKAEYITDDMEIIGILKELKSREERLWLWMPKTKTHPQRAVHFGVIKKYEIIDKYLEVRPISTAKFRFKFSHTDRELFIFSVSRGVAFKVPIKGFDDGFITFVTPQRMNVLNKGFLERIQLVEQENERKYSHLRQSPRKSAEGQTIGIERTIVNRDGEHLESGFYPLHDISQGGMGFLIEDPGEFMAGEQVVALSIDGNPLPKKLIGEVVAIRKTEDELFDTFKVGVKFL